MTSYPPPQSIDPSKNPEVRRRLRAYRLAVKLDGDPVPTSLESSSPFQASQSSLGSRSSASRTYPPAASEASYATSHTDYTTIWSHKDGSLVPDPKKKPLSRVMKTRKALIRYLGMCSRDCRKKKTKCFLSHFALRDVLDGDHDEQAESDVEWALDYHSETKGVGSSSVADDKHSLYKHGDNGGMMMEENPSTAQMAVIDDAATKLDMPSTPVPIYPSTINEDFKDLMEEPAHGLPQYSHNTSYQYLGLHHMFPPQQTFSTTRTWRTYPLATEIVGSNSNGLCLYYRCICIPGTCQQNFPSPEELLNHAQHQHGFRPLLPDPMRLVCPNCFEFYAENSATGMCWNIGCSSPGTLVVNICGELYLPGQGDYPP